MTAALAVAPYRRHHLSMMFLRLYGDCVKRAVAGIRKSPWTLVLPMLYILLTIVAGFVVSPLGPLIGGFVLGIVIDLCTSSMLYFTAQTVTGSPARPRELKQSFLEYFWPVVSFGFVVWIVLRILGYALALNPNHDIILLAVGACAGVLLNAVPEVIYQKGHVGGLAIITESISFIQRHWIEWFVPNLVLGAAIVGVGIGLARLPGGAFVFPVVAGALIYFVAAFRGQLFYTLENSSPFQLRQRYRR